MRPGVGAGGLFCMVALATGCGGEPTGEVARFTVLPGQTLSSVADSLEARDLVASAGRFKLLARLLGRQGDIQAGVFDIPVGVSSLDVLDVLVSGPSAVERVTVPEGAMIAEVATAVENSLGIPRDTFLAAVSDSALLREFGIPGSNFEGYLYPSTYFVPVDATAEAVVRQMAREFERHWQPGWEERAAHLGLSRHEVVTLASIIEGEVRYDADRPFTASVYHNRLSRGMRLQADPTVVYALGERRRLFERDYRTEHEYNTYLIDGLPPGPIGQPTEASLRAALYPPSTDFLYMVADTAGKHIFSRTLREHLAAVREIRQQRFGR